MVGLVIKDEKEAVTTDSIDKFPDIIAYLEVLKRITGRDWTPEYPVLKNCIYISCMIHYTIEVYRKNLISKEIYENVMFKGENMLRAIDNPIIIGLTLLYEGPYYLHPETIAVFKKAGYSKIVECYSNIFGALMEQVEGEKDLTLIYGDEKESYMSLYQNFLKMDDKKHE